MNWGKGIAIFIVAFMVFILSMVYRATQTDTDLHSVDYYEQEIDYQSKINALSNGNDLADGIDIEISANAITWQMPDTLNQVYEGEVRFYRPDNALLDQTIAMKLDADGKQGVSLNDFVQGEYQVAFVWQNQGENYRVAKTIYIP
jgi:hypothetical protein